MLSFYDEKDAGNISIGRFHVVLNGSVPWSQPPFSPQIFRSRSRL
jgi:hypothetical protein